MRMMVWSVYGGGFSLYDGSYGVLVGGLLHTMSGILAGVEAAFGG
jgi:hypothetical protein